MSIKYALIQLILNLLFRKIRAVTITFTLITSELILSQDRKLYTYLYQEIIHIMIYSFSFYDSGINTHHPVSISIIYVLIQTYSQCITLVTKQSLNITVFFWYLLIFNSYAIMCIMSLINLLTFTSSNFDIKLSFNNVKQIFTYFSYCLI